MTPYYQDAAVSIFHGSALDVLAKLPADYVQCVVTSPPYWGLRSYGTQAMIWEGESSEKKDSQKETDSSDDKCRHIWGAEDKSAQRQRNGAEGGIHEGRDTNKLAANVVLNPGTGSFCSICHAWRGELGLEPTPELYVEHIVDVFREVKRVLKDDGTIWVNLGDSYVANRGNTVEKPGHDNKAVHMELLNRKHHIPGKPKDLVGIPWRVAFALQADGWYLRSDIIWSKPNPMPESVTDRPTKSHEYIFLLSKKPRYYFDQEAVRQPSVTNDPRRPYTSEGAWQMDGRPIEQRHGGKVRSPAGWKTGPGSHGSIHENGREPEVKYVDDTFTRRNIRSVWEIATQPFSDWTKTVHWERGVGDARGDGILRIVSQGCLRHGDRFDLVASAFCDEHGPDLLIHNFDKRSYLFRERQPDFSPIGKRFEHLTELCNSGCSLQRCSLSATGHDSEFHKKAHALLTNPPCIVCDKTPLRIAGKLEELLKDGSVAHKLLNNISPADLAVHPLVQSSYYSEDKSSCCCEYYHKTFSETSHFATFPEALVKPCILAGSRPGDIVMDPFAGSGTALYVAKELGRRAIGIELNQDYIRLAAKRMSQEVLKLEVRE